VTVAAGNGARAVLLMGYGSPNGPAEIPGYLTEVLHGRVPTDAMVEDYRRRYARIGGSPQNRVLASLRSKLEGRVRASSPASAVYLSVKHGAPALKDVIPQAARDGFTELVAVATTPYASLWITEPYEAGIREGVAAASAPVHVEGRFGWHLDPDWIGYWARAIRAELARSPADIVLLSAHSLPQRMRDRGDPYPEILRATAEAIGAAIAPTPWRFTYQSAGNTTEPWLGPDITEVMLEEAGRGARRSLIASFGFVFDHLEVLYDLDVLVREFADQHRLPYRRVAMPNDAEEVVSALAHRALGPPVGPRET
jgi:ferrochelatase